MRYLTGTCPTCHTAFSQPDDPGRRREYCSSACRQAAYRARNRKTGHEARQTKADRERQEQDRRDREDREQRAYEDATRQARARRSSQQTGPDWTRPRATDTKTQASKRATCARLMERANHAKTPPAEAQSCREKADAIRARYGL